jgi:hypothetical protein
MTVKKMSDFEIAALDPTATVTATLVAVSEDPRAAELVALFNKADERGKHCMIAMARCMPCMRGG